MLNIEASPVLAFDAEVLRVRRLSPGFVRVTLGGAELADFGVPGPGLDLRFKLVVPVEGGSQEQILEALAPLRPQAPAGDLTQFHASWRQLPVEQRGEMRTYTLRALRREEAGVELDVDMVVHVGGEAGPAMKWAVQAAPGQRVALLGANLRVPVGYGIEWHPGGASEVLLVADETAVPAVAAILEALAADPAGVSRGLALLEVPCLEDVLEVTGPPGVEVRWLVRDDGPVGSQLLPELAARYPGGAAPEVAVSEPDLDRLWEISSGDVQGTYCWVAGEAMMVRDARRHLVGVARIDRSQVSFMGYWRAGHRQL